MKQAANLKSVAKTKRTAKLTPAAESQREFVIKALEKYERPLTAYANRILGGQLEAAQDAVQHTFMQLCQQPIAKVEQKLAPWLYSVCRNRILDDIKSRQRMNPVDVNEFDNVDPKALDPADRAEKIEFLRRLKGLIGKLAEKERECVELWSHGFNSKEISEILNQKSGTVRVNLHRGLKKLRQHPEVSEWLERATGQFDRSDVEHVSAEPTSKRNATTTTTGDRS